MDRGIIKVGMRGDIALIHRVRNLPLVTGTWAAGVQAHYRESGHVEGWGNDLLQRNMDAVSSETFQ